MMDPLGNVQSILVLGGSSEIGVAIASELASPRGAHVVLAGRSPQALEEAAEKVRRAGSGQVDVLAFDAVDFDSHEAFAQKTSELMGDIDVAVIAFGVLGDQEADEAGGQGAVTVAQTNYVGAMSISLPLARLMKAQGHGTLIVLSSVAGERVRRSNFIYGSSKAGLDGFAQGLAHSLDGSGVKVLIVRPGFVRSKMTSHMSAVPLSSTPQIVASETAKAMAKGREVIWVPGALRWVMMALRHLPSVLFKKIPM